MRVYDIGSLPLLKGEQVRHGSIEQALPCRPSGPRDVGSDDAVLSPQQRVVGSGRLSRQHIETGAGNVVIVQRSG
jgi:hypothetical protein